MVDGSEQSKLLDAYTKAVDEYRLTVAALTKVQYDQSEFDRALKVSEAAWKKAGEAWRTLQVSRSKKNP